ncbi:hypothetical protein DRO38_03300 [Candidatus Bathyarchaeota archaeon]|nr:MAG: hypothetical protein DRO38_03300 [Candidatus Bathyarchaeota archaeon]
MPVLASSSWGNDRKNKADQSPFRGFFDKVEDLPVGKKGDLAFVQRVLFVHDGTEWRQVIKDPIPSRTIWVWSGNIADIPAGYVLCDGTNGTPDLRDLFIVGAGGSFAVNSSGGADTIDHNHGETDIATIANAKCNYYNATHNLPTYHKHQLTGAYTNIPPYIYLAFIMKL